jgi:Family of unknown function (DUF5323)
MLSLPHQQGRGFLRWHHANPKWLTGGRSIFCRDSFSLAFHGSSTTACFAKHVNDKAARWAASKRPKKSRPSDINRKPTVYELSTIVKPPEYTVAEN